MNALRQIVKPIDRKIIIELPEYFDEEKEFEVIILPSDEFKTKKNRNDLFGKYKGKIWMSDDFNEPLEDFQEYM